MVRRYQICIASFLYSYERRFAQRFGQNNRLRKQKLHFRLLKTRLFPNNDRGHGASSYYFFKWWTLRPRSKATITVLFDLKHLSFALKPAAGVIIAVTKWRGGSVLFFNDLLASCSNDLLFHFSIEKIRSSIRWKGAFSYHESVRTFSLPCLPSPYAK